MKQELIQFKTALLAKDKGFVDHSYGPDNVPCHITQSLLQKFLREIHNIEVYVIPYNKENKKYYEVVVDECVTTWSGYNTYEEALEIGLLNGLNLIK